MLAITEKMVARAIITKQKQGQIFVLLVRKQREPHTFELPGGRRKRDERFVDALIRELYEEVNLKVSPKDCQQWGHGMFRTTNDPSRDVRTHVYTISGKGNLKAKNEIIECRFVSLDRLTHVPLERKTKIILWLYFRFGGSFS